jgi:regulator of cell morphogenesis and NO signaling
MLTMSDVTLAELAVTRPGAARVFMKHGLDFCCGGRRPLDEACAAKGLDARSVLAEVEAQPAVADDLTRWGGRPLPELIDHIVARYHGWLRDELPALLKMADKVETVHAEKASAPKGVTAELVGLHQEAMSHLQKEETILFPLIKSGRGASCGGPIQVMEAEHRDVGEALARIRTITKDHTPPAEACNTWRALYLGLERLEVEFFEHIHLENNILFPRALCE